MKTVTIVDLALYAASICHNCRSLGRPIDESDQEHGDSFRHKVTQGVTVTCKADQIWSLIRYLEPLESLEKLIFNPHNWALPEATVVPKKRLGRPPGSKAKAKVPTNGAVIEEAAAQ